MTRMSPCWLYPIQPCPSIADIMVVHESNSIPVCLVLVGMSVPWRFSLFAVTTAWEDKTILSTLIKSHAEWLHLTSFHFSDFWFACHFIFFLSFPYLSFMIRWATKANHGMSPYFLTNFNPNSIPSNNEWTSGKHNTLQTQGWTGRRGALADVTLLLSHSNVSQSSSHMNWIMLVESSKKEDGRPAYIAIR